MLLIAQGDRATGVSFSVASPSIRLYKCYLEAHMRDTNVTLLGKILRTDEFRSKQRSLDGMKQCFSFMFATRADRDIIAGSIVSDQIAYDEEWLVDGSAVPPHVVRKRACPPSDPADPDRTEPIEKKR